MRECTHFASESLVSPLKSSVTTAPDTRERIALSFLKVRQGWCAFQSVSGLFGGFAIGSIDLLSAAATHRPGGETDHWRS